MATLSSTPDEVVSYIIGNLSLNDISRLSITSKRLHQLANPLFWANIELHSSAFHHGLADLQHPPSFRDPTQRVFITSQSSSKTLNENNNLFFNILLELQAKDKARFASICALIRSFCATIDSAEKWQIVQHFINLRALEVDGTYFQDFHRLGLRTLSYDRLQVVKLFGYIPRSAATAILRCISTLERLELGLLDRPIGNASECPEEFLPLPEDNINIGSDQESDYGSLISELPIPRALSGYAQSGQASFTNLRHLYVCQPCAWDFADGDSDYSWSTRAERSACEDLKRLLLACRDTLEILVFELRPGGHDMDAAGWSEIGFVNDVLNGNDNFCGSAVFLDMVTDTLFQNDRIRFPALKKVYLYGIGVCDYEQRIPSESLPGGRLMLRLKDCSIRCEARQGSWVIMLNGNPVVDLTMSLQAEWDPDEVVDRDVLLAQI